jgi:peptidoglycan/LPS O-acetylase OafA/YrhL
MSWHRQKTTGWHTVSRFFLRRYLRIAPMYYFGALFYFLADPPATGFDIVQMMRSLLFVNVWHPDWVPTTSGWMVVPGGWSIGVEFTFYALFPLLAASVTSLLRAALFFALTLLIAIGANQWGALWLAGIAPQAVENFLYFWFFNQAPFFALGFVLYHLLRNPPEKLLSLLRAHWRCDVLVLIIVGLFVVVAEHPTQSNRFGTMTVFPTVFLAALLFMGLILIMGKGSPTLLVHRWIQRLGVVSFSAYILHFIFVQYIPVWCGAMIEPRSSGWHAIVMFLALWLLTILLTLIAATVTHRLIEQPGINLARRIISGPDRLQRGRVSCHGRFKESAWKSPDDRQ